MAARRHGQLCIRPPVAINKGMHTESQYIRKPVYTEAHAHGGQYPASRAQARGCEKQIKQTQDEPQWIVAQRLLSALTIPGFNLVVCKEFITSTEEN